LPVQANSLINKGANIVFRPGIRKKKNCERAYQQDFDQMLSHATSYTQKFGNSLSRTFSHYKIPLNPPLEKGDFEVFSPLTKGGTAIHG
jgi:hypothetical protein